jgi:hypothetical protein
MFGISSKFSMLCLNALGISMLTLGAFLPGFLLSQPATALDNRQVAFDSSPRLSRAAVATYPGIGALAQYQFTITMPKNAGKPLQSVKITQQENLERIRFDLSRSRAFAGERLAGGSAVSLASIRGSDSSNANEVTFVFDPPAQPGSSVTVVLRGKRPTWGGIYLFRVTAFPVGENSVGSYLGSGRMAFP